MNSAYERLKAVITALGYTSNEKFEDTVGLGHGFVSRITSNAPIFVPMLITYIYHSFILFIFIEFVANNLNILKV